MALTFEEQYDRAVALSKDDSTTNTTLLKDLINEKNQEIVGLRDWYFLEKERTASSVADQQEYQVPNDYGRLISLWTEVDDVIYYPEEAPDLEYWQYLNATDESSDITTDFIIYDDYIHLYPTPSSTDVTIHILYRQKAVEMTEDDYTTGTIATTSGDETVTGTATTFTEAMEGRYIKVSGRWYEISSRTSNTELELVKPALVSASGETTQIGEMSPIPGEFHDLLWKGALAEFYDYKGDENPWERRYRERLAFFMRQYGSGKKSSSQILRRVGRNSTKLRNPNDFPTDLG